MGENAAHDARPLRADARRNRDQVLAVARDMLSVEGSAVSFDEIARRAGVGVGTVYRHFPTRNALFEAVVIGRVEEFTERARLRSEAATSGEVFCDYFAHLVGEIALNQALCEALDDSDDIAVAMPARLRDEFIRSFETLLVQAKRDGTIRDDVDLADVLDLLIGTATAERRARSRDSGSPLIAVVLDGLRATSSS
ncbi:TetR/AcrR family transcriptional regulator [Nocardia macrotermitis]|nr:TetR/AcrR family transcriptional regulator [Nocardia macrotermitis]